jgi:iron complex outermembrane receptor protein
MFNGSFTLSKNQIVEFDEYIDDWDTGEQGIIRHSKTSLALSPNFIASAGIQYSKSIKKNRFETELLTKYVSKQFIDNTGNKNRKLSAYTFSDLVTSYSLPLNKGEVRLKASLRNLFNSKYSTSAWTYSFISNGYDPTPDDPYSVNEGNGVYNLTGHYPQAGVNILLGVEIIF